MNPFFNLLFIVILNCNCFAQSFTFNQGGTTEKHYYNEIPYEFINGKIFIYVKVAGKKQKFLFDTGSPSAINKELAAELKFPELYKDLARDAHGNQDSVTIISLKEIKIGNVTFNNISAFTIIPDFLKCWMWKE